MCYTEHVARRLLKGGAVSVKRLVVREERGRAAARITKRGILSGPVEVIITDDRVELEFSDATGQRSRIYLDGYYNQYYPDGLLPDTIWEAYVLDPLGDMTPAARAMLSELREQVIDMMRRGEIPAPAEMAAEVEIDVAVKGGSK